MPIVLNDKLLLIVTIVEVALYVYFLPGKNFTVSGKSFQR